MPDLKEKIIKVISKINDLKSKGLLEADTKKHMIEPLFEAKS